jgi:FlaA1/EpsC-like NDP-sugar epimerase
MFTKENNDYVKFFAQIVGRGEVELLSNAEIYLKFSNSRILIVGAGGTIGSSISSRLISAGLKNVFFFDRDESSLHALALSLSNVSASLSQNCFVGDIRDAISIRKTIEITEPSIVIHAAALKHLVILEKFPREGYLTNIRGTLNVAQACLDLNVKKFINISTDKAAHPISVLGKTKKLAELITEDLLRNSQTAFASVRFGNVFASRGSVIETFIHQIENNLPVTITDRKACRYFMSRNEAGNLVLAATALESTGTYIQNMGQEVPIIDIVTRLADYLGKRVELQYIGLQKGEKISETLYDGPTSETIYPDISKSTLENKPGIVLDLGSYLPESDEDAIEIIEQLVSSYL